jgi:hypothetical protein
METQPAENPANESSSLLAEATSSESLDFSKGRPESFPEDFWDSEKNSPAVDKLFSAYKQESERALGLRQKLSKGQWEGKAPEDVKEYALELDEKAKQFVPEDDPLLAAARNAAKEAGLPKEVFSKFMAPIMQQVVKLGEERALEQAEPSEEEKAEYRRQEIEKLGPGGARVVSAVSTFVKSMESSGKISPDDVKTINQIASTADGVRVLNRFRSMLGGSDIPVIVNADTQVAKADIEKKMVEAFSKGDEVTYNKYAAQLHNM